VVQHQRLVEQRLRDRERAMRVARREHALGDGRGRAQVDGRGWVVGRHGAGTIVWGARAMARRRTTSKDLSDAVRDAVDRTVQATLGSAQQTRDRAQQAADELVDTVEDMFRGAEAGLARTRPVTQNDLAELRGELRAIARRLDAIEDRLPKRRAAPAKKRAPAKRAPAKKRAAPKK
jgi:hypothetical protein